MKLKSHLQKSLDKSAEKRQKRLGQFFTNPLLARLLASLSSFKNVRSILDPMAGTGNLLLASRDKFGDASIAYGGIEIDPSALRSAKEKMPWCNLILGDVFNPDTIDKLPGKQWDLIITNPPYVRYQNLSKLEIDEFAIPSNKDIRSNLLRIIEGLDHLDQEDRELFTTLVNSYSGLADMAVPSWILCAALCATNGTLAIILPESWWSREYSLIVRYMLFRWFKIKYIVDDMHAHWFHGAQVKTSLLVAEKIPRKRSALNWMTEDHYLHIKLSGEAFSNNSLVGNLVEGSSFDPEGDFVQLTSKWLSSGQSYKTNLVDAKLVSIGKSAESLIRSSRGQKWLSKLENNTQKQIVSDKHSESFTLPSEIRHWLIKYPSKTKFTTLESLGVNIGQGLRTGANSFFYVTLALDNEKKDVDVVLSPLLGGLREVIPSNVAYPVVRKQSDLSEAYVVKPQDLIGRVLMIHKYAHPDDIKRDPELSMFYKTMPKGLVNIINSASRVSVNGKHIWELSAVSPNTRNENKGRDTKKRFWYMLPDLSPRHNPDVFIPRVNSGIPKVYLNSNRASIIDANFSTLWLSSDSKVDIWSLLALLNSSWCWAVLEYSSAIMGGGALKVEAAHLRKIPMPILSKRELEHLSKLGKMFDKVDEKKIKQKIDELIISSIVGDKFTVDAYNSLLSLSNEKMSQRKNHKNFKYKGA